MIGDPGFKYKPNFKDDNVSKSSCYRFISLFPYLECQYYVFYFVFSWGPNMRPHTWLECIKYSFISLEYRPNSPTREFTSCHTIQWWEWAQRDLILFQRIYIQHYITIYYNHGLFAKGRLCSNLSELSAFSILLRHVNQHASKQKTFNNLHSCTVVLFVLFLF